MYIRREKKSPERTKWAKERVNCYFYFNNYTPTQRKRPANWRFYALVIKKNFPLTTKWEILFHFQVMREKETRPFQEF